MKTSHQTAKERGWTIGTKNGHSYFTEVVPLSVPEGLTLLPPDGRSSSCTLDTLRRTALQNQSPAEGLGHRLHESEE